jgi:CRP/FNR family transcriptional regulator, cyclic AMP receptor protein
VRQKRHSFDPDTFLSTIGEGRRAVRFTKKQTVFAQGDATDAVFYIQTGKIKLTVISNNGKEATIGILGQGDFFGEGCLAGQPFRMGSASAITSCDILRIDKRAMMQALHREHKLSDMFVAYLFSRWDLGQPWSSDDSGRGRRLGTTLSSIRMGTVRRDGVMPAHRS